MGKSSVRGKPAVADSAVEGGKGSGRKGKISLPADSLLLWRTTMAIAICVGLAIAVVAVVRYFLIVTVNKATSIIFTV